MVLFYSPPFFVDCMLLSRTINLNPYMPGTTRRLCHPRFFKTGFMSNSGKYYSSNLTSTVYCPGCSNSIFMYALSCLSALLKTTLRLPFKANIKLRFSLPFKACMFYTEENQLSAQGNRIPFNSIRAVKKLTPFTERLNT